MAPCSCEQCQKRQEKRKHRKAPDIRKFPNALPGTCCVCGETVYQGGKREGEKVSRGWWHQECVDRYNFLKDPATQRKKVHERDKGICAGCQKDCGRSAWELDHIQPLIDGGSFELENMQTLCSPCHKVKTGREATERAAKRKAAANE